MKYILNNDRLLAVQCGGFLMILAAAICFFFIKEKRNESVDDSFVDEMKIIEERSV